MTARFLIPGWSLGRGPLQATADALGARFLDLPGYRDSAPCAEAETAVRQLADALPAGSQLIGWSLGAQLALAIAAACPDKVSRLLLIAGTASFQQRPDWLHAMPAAQLAGFRTAVAGAVENTFPRFVGSFNRGDARAKTVTQAILGLADPLPPVDVLTCGLDWLRDMDLRPVLPAVTVPVRLIHGGADPLMPLAAAEALASALPDARLHVMADCAHAPFLSDPAGFLRLATDCLDG